MKMTTTSENDMQQIYVPKTARARGQKQKIGATMCPPEGLENTPFQNLSCE